MSGIFGCWDIGGSSVDLTLLNQCAASLGSNPFSARVQWSRGPVGLASKSAGPSISKRTHLVPEASTGCVFDGRLDNRDELLGTLTGHSLAAPGCHDRDLVVAAYDRFADAFVEHLDGDFALALFDSRTNRLLLARDRLGVRPLCYTTSKGTFLFASNAKALLAYPGIEAVPDAAMLADFILSFVSTDAETRTFFEGIHSVPPAHVMIVTPTSSSMRRYYQLDTTRRVRLRGTPDYVEAFHDLFTRAVRNRLRGPDPVAMTVSGGLDSAYIFCVAQRLLKEGQAGCPAVFGFNYEGWPGSPSEEGEFVRELERACDARITRIPQRPGFMESAGRAVRQTESPIVDSLARHAEAAFCAMRDAGARRLLTGHWGDQFLFDSDYVLDLLRSGRWRQLRRHAKAWGISLRQLAIHFSRDVAARHLPDDVKIRAREATAREGSLPWQAPWFTDRFRRRLRERAAYAPLPRPSGSRHAFAIYRQARLGYHVQCMEWNHRTAAMHGLDIAFPYLDCDLIQFLMSIPGEVQSLDGVPRGLMRAAMRGIVPDSIVDRRSKGEFTHLTNETIRYDFGAISEILGPSALSVQFGYIEGPVLWKALGEWRDAVGAADNAIVANRLIDLCGFELLLREFFSRPERQSGELEHLLQTAW